MTGVISRVEIQLTMEPTHQLESQGQASSAGSKSSSPQNPLTDWRAKDMHHQQGQNPAHHESHSPPGEPRIGIISGAQIQLGAAATHILDGSYEQDSNEQGSAATHPLHERQRPTLLGQSLCKV